MDRGTVRNMQSFNPKINLSNQCIQLVLLQGFVLLQFVTIYLSDYLHIYANIYPLTHLPTSPLIHLFNYLPTYLSRYIIYLSACLCICLCTYGIRISIHLFVNRPLILGTRRLHSKSVNTEFSFGIQHLEILSDLTLHSCFRDHDSCCLCSSYHNKSLAQSYNQ